MRNGKLTHVIALTLLLAGCGGGGSYSGDNGGSMPVGNTPPPPAPPPPAPPAQPPADAAFVTFVKQQFAHTSDTDDPIDVNERAFEFSEDEMALDDAFGSEGRSGTAGRLAAALLICGAMLAGAAAAAPYEPRSDQTVLETLPSKSPRPRPRSVASSDINSAITAASSYIEAARTTGDPRFLGYAQATLGSWWQAARPPTPVALLRAQIRQHNHAFAPALADLDYVLASEPRNAQARLIALRNSPAFKATMLRQKPIAAASRCSHRRS